jgi:hypothetical protein
LDRFGSDHVRSAQVAISKAWVGQAGRINAITDAKEFLSLQADVIEKHELVQHIWTIVDFFDGLALCIKENLCDTKSAQAFFLGYAQRFADLHTLYIVEQRSAFGDEYGEGLRIFVSSATTPSPAVTPSVIRQSP